MRLSVRRMMVVVLGLGVGTHLTVAAWRAQRSSVMHVHSAILENGGNPAKAVGVRRQPFWPAFWRRSIGRSRGDRCAGSMGDDALLEMCELANPEIRRPSPPNMYGAYYTEEQLDLCETLRKASVGPRQARGPRLVRIAGPAMSWLLDSALPRVPSVASAARIAGFCASGIERILTNSRESASPGKR